VLDAKTDRILGASVLCIESQEVINLLALAMRAERDGESAPRRIWMQSVHD
jgi:pyruvate/2-oxoglutarate dehydrogenase complex dihydrolipoamide dehydrogenase (E3) component